MHAFMYQRMFIGGTVVKYSEKDLKTGSSRRSIFSFYFESSKTIAIIYIDNIHLLERRKNIGEENKKSKAAGVLR